MADSNTPKPPTGATFNEVTQVLTDKFGNTASIVNKDPEKKIQSDVLIIKGSKSCELSGSSPQAFDAHMTHLKASLETVRLSADRNKHTELEFPKPRDATDPKHGFVVTDVGDLTRFCGAPVTPKSPGKGSAPKLPQK